MPNAATTIFSASLQLADLPELHPEEIEDADEVGPGMVARARDDASGDDEGDSNGSESTGESLKTVLQGWPADDAESSESQIGRAHV